MKRTRENGRAKKKDSTPAVRASISFPPDLYASLETIAADKKVSLAWVVRDAAEIYVANETMDASTNRHTGKTRRAS